MLEGNLTGLQHLGLPVSDIDPSKSFYQQLGFREILYKELPTQHGTIKVSMLEFNDFVLELYQLAGQELAEIKTRRHGHIDHFALDVIDIQRAFSTIREAGLATLEDEPVYLPFWEKGIYYFNILGPDGEKVEFSERIK